jgi:hypothetical protein
VRTILVAVTPLLLTLLFGWLTTEGYLNLGAGCKDVFLAVPMLAWSLVFFLCCIVSSWRKLTVNRSIVTSAAVATALVVFAWVVLLGISMLQF